VILHGYVEYLASLHELSCYYPVVRRRCRIPARVVVDEDDSGRPLSDRFPKYFSRMHERRVEEAASYGDVALEPVLRIEHGDVELFNRKILQALRKDLIHVARPAHGRSFLPLLRRHASTQLERGMDTNRTSRSYTTYARKSGDWLRREQAK
jgi:hypothetical protein